MADWCGGDDMRDDNDWRLVGQEKWLKGVELVYRKYRQNPKNPDWDHDHCEFCNMKFFLKAGPDYLKEGYTTLDDYHWICSRCFEDFKDLFEWTVVPAEKSEKEKQD